VVHRGTGSGAVAAGHAETARAARLVLEDGGNAFDAVLAAVLAACVAEPILCSLGGGGFLLARPAEAAPRVFDFFAQTPKRCRSADEVDFRPVVADFGTATQEFHCGMGAIATPGVAKGLFAVHAALGRMPLADIAAPALTLARDGVPLGPFPAYLLTVVRAILDQSQGTRELYFGTDGALLREGEVFRLPAFADALDALVHEGADLFYRGEIGQALVADCMARGGHLTMADLEDYEVAVRAPLAVPCREAVIYTNPPPAAGGALIAFALEMLKDSGLAGMEWGGPAHRALLARVMDLTNQARADGAAEDAGALLAPEVLARWHAQVQGRPRSFRGTTHISVVDGVGNAAALSVSNGEGAGYVIPGTAIQMNNMLGEEDLNPGGFFTWARDTRLASMMAPTLVLHADGAETALGSGGSNRIRTAILQVVSNMLDFGMPVEAAVAAPRLHCEPGHVAAEEDLPAEVRAEWPEVTVWPEQNMFFGGVHAVHRDARGGLSGAGDARRAGVAVVV